MNRWSYCCQFICHFPLFMKVFLQLFQNFLHFLQTYQNYFTGVLIKFKQFELFLQVHPRCFHLILILFHCPYFLYHFIHEMNFSFQLHPPYCYYLKTFFLNFIPQLVLLWPILLTYLSPTQNSQTILRFHLDHKVASKFFFPESHN